MRIELSLCYAAACAVLYLAPGIAPRQLLFSVRTAEGFRDSDTARRAIRSYRMWIAAAFAVGLTLTWLMTGEASVLWPPLVLFAAGGLSYWRQHRGLTPYAVKSQRPDRSLAFSAEPDRLPRYAWMAALPLAMLTATALSLHRNWYNIPERFPVHWSADGRPNGWSNRTLRGVYGPLVFGAGLILWFLLLEWSVWFGSRRSAYRLMIVRIATAMSVGCGLLVSTIAFLPLWRLSPRLLAGTAVSVVLANVVAGILAARSAVGAPMTDLEEARQQGGVTGMFYFNRNDSALYVPMRSGAGFVPNLAHVTPWLVFLLPVIGSAVLFLAVR